MKAANRLKVLWLCSWYPSTVEPFAGDFIQRHAEAVSNYSDVHVLHAIGSSSVRTTIRSAGQRNPHLLEWIVLYPKRTFLQRWMSPIRWWFMMQSMMRTYFGTYGRPDIIHVQVPFKSGLIARYHSWRYKIPFVVTEHWGIYNPSVKDWFGARSPWFRLLTRIAYRKSSLLLSVSAFQARQLDIFLGQIPTLLIPNVVDTRIFHSARVFTDRFVFLHVSDWSQNKNPEAIIRCFSRMSAQSDSIQLLLVGGKGDRYEAVKRLAAEHNDRITLYQEVSYKDVARIMQSADCLLLFSYSENSPCVIGEALCSGLQVISSDVGGVSELIDPECSQLVPAGDEDALYMSMLRAIQIRSMLDRESISRRAHIRFSYDVVGQQIQQAYKSVLNQIKQN